MPIKMTLRQKLTRLSGNTPCVINFGEYEKKGRPFELLTSLSDEELNRTYFGSTYSVFTDGSRKMRIRV